LKVQACKLVVGDISFLEHGEPVLQGDRYGDVGADLTVASLFDSAHQLPRNPRALPDFTLGQKCP
jgi:hypothetical protein